MNAGTVAAAGLLAALCLLIGACTEERPATLPCQATVDAVGALKADLEFPKHLEQANAEKQAGDSAASSPIPF